MVRNEPDRTEEFAVGFFAIIALIIVVMMAWVAWTALGFWIMLLPVAIVGVWAVGWAINRAVDRWL